MTDEEIEKKVKDWIKTHAHTSGWEQKLVNLVIKYYDKGVQQAVKGLTDSRLPFE